MKTIKIKEETHEKLSNIGKKNETFDEIINRLIKEFEEEEEEEEEGVLLITQRLRKFSANS